MTATAPQQHSPGPWAPHLGQCSCRMIWDASGEVVVAVVHGQHWSSSEAIGDPWPTDTVADANLRLIAAATEGLEAARFAMSVLEANPVEMSERMAIEKLRAFLAKATRVEP